MSIVAASPVIHLPLVNRPPTQDIAPVVPASADERHAARVADAIIRGGRQASVGTRTLPELRGPVADVLDASQLMALLPAFAGQHPTMVPGASAEAFVVLHRLALQQANQPDVEIAATDSGVVAQARTLVGLVSANGELVYPSAEEMRALAGHGNGVPPHLQALGELLGDAPRMREVLDQAANIREEELPVRLNGDPRMAYVLLLVAMLLTLAASHREQAAAMITFAEKSVQAMGARMVDSAKAMQTGKIVALSVGSAVAVGGVAMGAVAAYRNIGSIGKNQADGNQLNLSSNKQSAGVTESLATGPEGVQANQPQVGVVKTPPRTTGDQSGVLSDAHAISSAKSGVLSQGGYALGQAGQSAGAAASSPLEIEAAGQSAQGEANRHVKETVVSMAQAANQEFGKAIETSTALVTQSKAGEQDKAEANHLISNRMGK